jgi:DnaJ-class molecular chaperone
MPVEKYAICTQCYGTGSRLNGVMCDACMGSGRVPVSDPPDDKKKEQR